MIDHSFVEMPARPAAASFVCLVRRLRHVPEYDEGDFREREKDISDREISILGRHMAQAAEAVREKTTAQVRELVRLAPGDSVKSRIGAAARGIGLPACRIAKMWYGLARRIEAHEADQIRAYYKSAQKLIEAREAYEQLRQQLLANRPGLARFVPGPLAEDDVSAAAEVAAASKFGRELAKRK